MWLATIESGALRGVLQAHADRLPHVYLESETRVIFAPLRDLLADPGRISIPAARWSRGRAFGPTLEIAWRRVDPLLVTLHALSENDQAPSTALAWTASPWNAQLDRETRRREVQLLEDAYSGYEAIRCIDYCSGGVVVMTRLAEALNLVQG